MKKSTKFMLMATFADGSFCRRCSGVTVQLDNYCSANAVGSSVNRLPIPLHFSFAPILSGQYFTEQLIH